MRSSCVCGAKEGILSGLNNLYAWTVSIPNYEIVQVFESDIRNKINNALLGLDPPACWIGRPFDEAFDAK